MAGVAGGGVAGVAEGFGTVEAGGAGAGLGIGLSSLWLTSSTSKISSAFAGMAGGWPAGSVGELVRDEESAFAAYTHSVQTRVPAGNDAVLAVLNDDRLIAMFRGGVELGPICKIAGVKKAIELTVRDDRSSADLRIHVSQRHRGAVDAESFVQRRLVFHGRHIIQLDDRHLADDV